MTKLKQTTLAKPGCFQAIANVNFSLPVAMYTGVKNYNDRFQKEMQSVNGTETKLAARMTLRFVTRGDILNFGPEVVVDEETGAVEVYPEQVFYDMTKRSVELPCAMMGDAKSNFEKAMAALPLNMRKEFDGKKNEVTARFRVKPILEKYTGQTLED